MPSTRSCGRERYRPSIWRNSAPESCSSGKLPGPKNALGLVKFIFPNSYNVYMHDTPAPELFAQSRRDFSHGCIRLERPADLAAWVLRDNPGMDPGAHSRRHERRSSPSK